MEKETRFALRRREFIAGVGGAAALTLAPGFLTGCASVHSRRKQTKTVALLATEVRRHSHAQHFIDRFLEGYGWNGQWHTPKVQLVSLYVDQFPEGELALDRSRRFQVPIYSTIEEALTLGGSKLAVDGVVIIGEHGKYPRNEKRQTLYPRYKWFKEIVHVFEKTGETAPVWNDKHLSTDWSECVEMVEDAKRLKFPFFAGSSLPVTWRIPAVDVPLGAELEESVCVCYGGVDSYDFHGLETAQCMSERRRGGESGIRHVLALRGEKLWRELEGRGETLNLFLAALARSHTMRAPEGFTTGRPSLELSREFSPDAAGYFIEHRDGFKTAMFMCNGLVRDFTYAGRYRDGKVTSCQMHLPMPGFSSTTADFFNPVMHHIEDMILTGRVPYPAERTLLTSGMTLAGVESLHRGETLVETPEMKVAYQVNKPSTYWNVYETRAGI